MTDKPQDSKLLAWLVFLIWPLGAVLYAYKNYNKQWGKNILWAFVAFYGFIFTIPPNSNIDANFYRDYLKITYNHNISFGRLIESLYSTDGIVERYNYDIFQPVLTYLVAQFTDNYHILFLTVGIVFGYFFSRSIWLILEVWKNELKPWTSILLVALFFIIAPWTINWVRFYTAALVFVYGSLLYYYKKKKSGLVISIMSALIHFSFFLPIMILVINLILGKKLNLKVLHWIVIFTMPLSIISIDTFANISSIISPEFFVSKIEGYTSDRNISRVRESLTQRSLYTIVYDYFKSIIIFLSTLFFYRYRKDILIYQPQSFNYLLTFILLFALTMNLVGFVPSLDRFYRPLLFLYLGYLIMVYQNPYLNISPKWKLIIAPIFMLYVIGEVRYAVGYGIVGFEYVYKSPIYLLIE